MHVRHGMCFLPAELAPLKQVLGFKTHAVAQMLLW
jgi:hypothetical protein